MASPSFQGAHDFHVTNLSIGGAFGGGIFHPSGLTSPLERLQENITTEAMHSSSERCDEPMCHPETRVAVQEEIMSWITKGDLDAQPMRIMWLTGPAGAGKTAIAGSIAETCHEKGTLAASFFFSSFSQSQDRRSKRFLVPTLAYQLFQHTSLRGMKQYVLDAVEWDPTIFKKKLKEQVETLILKPLRQSQAQHNSQGLPQVLIVDGLDEVRAEQHRDPGQAIAPRSNEDDHLEILLCLLHASKDPVFPFRVLIVSRPERVFTEFFSSQGQPTSAKLFLDEKYDPDSDIRLYLTAKFAELRRRYGLPASWPDPGVIEKLVENASGQFIYAATVARFISDKTNPPPTQLNRILNLRTAKAGVNPFAPLDALYTIILMSSPVPNLAAQWIFCIANSAPLPAWYWRTVLEETPGEAEHLLGALTSLMFIPPPEDHTSAYHVYHKSLFDFLGDSQRCPPFLDVRSPGANQSDVLLTKALTVIMKYKGPAALVTPLEREHLVRLTLGWAHVFARACSPISSLPDSDLLECDLYWWTTRVVKHGEYMVMAKNEVLSTMFSQIHTKCSWYRCREPCKVWRKEIMGACKAHGWSVPSERVLLLHRLEAYQGSYADFFVPLHSDHSSSNLPARRE